MASGWYHLHPPRKGLFKDPEDFQTTSAILLDLPEVPQKDPCVALGDQGRGTTPSASLS